MGVLDLLDIKYDGVKANIKSASRHIMAPKDVDAELSIKCSINALEGYIKGWITEKDLKSEATLGKNIGLMRKHKLIHEKILSAMEQFYIYRNMTENIGHGDTELSDTDIEEAKLFYEAAISFINYFHNKR